MQHKCVSCERTLLPLYQCDNCDQWFCEDHGQIGGDRQVQDVGAVAVPSICDECLFDSWW